MVLVADDCSYSRWWCANGSAASPRVPNASLAPRFPGLVRRSARMTERLMEVFQTVGVTTNGADAARMVWSLGMPTSATTIIRQVLRLPLPAEGSVSKVGIDEWAW